VRAEATQAPWGLGVLARSRALMAANNDAEELYREAIDQLAQSGVRTALARAHLLYGEWLLDVDREDDAHQALRIAHDMFSTMGAQAFAARARRRLGAAFVARPRVVGPNADLTPQEAQIAQLAADGATNSEIAAQVFLSASTDDYHLRKVF